MIAANNGHVIALDNLSHLPAWLSDNWLSACDRRWVFDEDALRER